jgi:acyl-CoA thioester hydrolase
MEFLTDYPIVIEIPVVWGEMDAYGHVNNIIYFRYFESARIKYFEKMQFLEHKEESGIGPILAHTQCRFKLPLTYPDQVLVGARVPKLDRDRFVMEYIIVSKKYEKVVATGDSLIICYDYNTNQKAPLPESLIQRIKHIERQT